MVKQCVSQQILNEFILHFNRKNEIIKGEYPNEPKDYIRKGYTYLEMLEFLKVYQKNN